MQKNTLAILVGFAALSIMVTQGVVAQTTLVTNDFYVATSPKTPIAGNGAIGSDQVKCNGGDQLIQGSYNILKRDPQDATPDATTLAERFNTTPQGVTRTYEVTVRVFSPDFVDLRVKALCLDMG